MDDLLGEIHKRAAKNERVLVTTLTKKMAEDLTEFLKEMAYEFVTFIPILLLLSGLKSFVICGLAYSMY